MVFNTLSVGAAVTPAVVKTCTSHYTNRKSRHQKPTAHISYDEGLNLIRSFLTYASSHTVEDLQAFTSQWVPNPRWVKVDEVAVPEESIVRAADALSSQLGHKGIDMVGGSTWWRWRREGNVLKAEWIEMRGDHERRQVAGDKGKRVMLYVHGGAYFFGSVDEHRYQLQRHARKLKARVFARLLVILRDQGLPLPAGAILISPWVDLTHSFPSVAGDNNFDYIPSHGFLQKPSAAWPPPNAEDMEEIAIHAVEQVVDQSLPRKSSQQARKKAEREAVQGFSTNHNPESLHAKANDDNSAGLEGAGVRPGNTIPGPGHDLSIMIDDNFIEIKDQIQMYATNQLISHPLVSPALQPSLGGLPPLLILTGGGEVLRDEQIYVAHKAASPSKYPPGDFYFDEYPEARDVVAKWKPTDVQLQVWDDLCHVAPTLSFTRPAKFMFRSIAQFGAWALARAQKTEIEIQDDDDISVISSGSDTGTDTSSGLGKPKKEMTTTQNGVAQGGGLPAEKVGKAGDPLPPFRNHMIRQKVDRHGIIYPLGPTSSLPALQMRANDIGVIKPGPVRKWMAAKKEWDTKYAREKQKVQKQRVKEMAKGYQGFGNDEVPPPSALAGRRGVNMPKEKKKGHSWGMSLWSRWGSSHDEKTVEREEKADKEPETFTATISDGIPAGRVPSTPGTKQSRSRSRHRAVTDAGQTNHDKEDINENTSATEILRRRGEQTNGENLQLSDRNHLSPTFVSLRSPVSSPTSESRPRIHGEELDTSSKNDGRPTGGGMAYPFKLGHKLGDEGVNASTVTLTSQAGVIDMEHEEGTGLEKDIKVNGDDENEPKGASGGEVKRPDFQRFETAREF